MHFKTHDLYNGTNWRERGDKRNKEKRKRKSERE